MNRFNLLDEPWIPVVDVGNVSLLQVFTQPEYRALGGSPVEKIALLKLLQAIAQAAITPNDETEWQQLGSDGLAAQCRQYLEKWRNRFYLYGERPFLQMPAIGGVKRQPFGAVLPEVSTGNTTILSNWQIENALNDAQKALLIITQMAFALGGKKADNSIVLSEKYQGKTKENGKPKSSGPGPAVAHLGLLHSFCLGETLQQTVWLNLFTQENILSLGMFETGIGSAPWESMPQGEDCTVARELKASLIGRLVPLCRFCLLHDEGLHFSEGILHGSYKEGFWDPSVGINRSGKENKATWAEPERRPWRQLTSLLGFIGQDKNYAECSQLRIGTRRASQHLKRFAVWSGGLRVSSNAGEQYVSGSDDNVSSEIWIESEYLGESWFNQLKQQMTDMEDIAKHLYAATAGYFRAQKVDGSEFAKQATSLYWQRCEADFQSLIMACGSTTQSELNRQLTPLRNRFIRYAENTYHQLCPKSTARQMQAWAQSRPDLRQFRQKEL